MMCHSAQEGDFRPLSFPVPKNPDNETANTALPSAPSIPSGTVPVAAPVASPVATPVVAPVAAPAAVTPTPPVESTQPPHYRASSPSDSLQGKAGTQKAPVLPPVSPQEMLLALFSFLPAYLYIRDFWFQLALGIRDIPLPFLGALSIPLIAFLYLFLVECLARLAKRPIMPESFVWAGCFVAQSIALALYGMHAGPLGGWQIWIWHLTAVWVVLSRCNMLAAGHSSSLVFLDLFSGLFALPWPNFFSRSKIFLCSWNQWRQNRLRKSRPIAAIVISVGAALLACLFAWCELSAVDANFAGIGTRLGNWLFSLLNWEIWRIIYYFLLSIPVGSWVFGLIHGALRRNKPVVSTSSFLAGMEPFRRVPAFSFVLVSGCLCGVYALFFVVQALEFSARLGGIGLSAPDVSQFAVDGFWELCRILLLNFFVLTLQRFFGAVPLRQSRLQQVMATLLCVCGAGFALLAASKLVAYAGLYGLTPRRILAGWFLGVQVVWVILLTIWIWRPLPAARIGLLVLAISFSCLCCVNIEKLCISDFFAHTDISEVVENPDILWQYTDGNYSLQKYGQQRLDALPQ